MKKIMFPIIVLLGLSAAQESRAQISLSINIGSQPAWGPTGYNHVDFYYLPDINAYYDVTRAQYVYQNGAQWVYVSSLPSRYRNYDIYNSYKVVVNEPRPFLHNNVHISQYARYKGNHNQQIIRDSRDERYYQSAGHPKYQIKKDDRNRGYVKGNDRNDRYERNENQRNNNKGNRRN